MAQTSLERSGFTTDTEGLWVFAIGLEEPATFFGMTTQAAPTFYAITVIGNTVTHGIILGALALIPTVSALESRADRLFPNAAGGQRRSASIDQGKVLGVIGPVEAGNTTLSMALAGFVPDVTGGISGGRIRVADRDPRDVSDTSAATVFEDYSAQITQLRVLDEAVAPLVDTGTPRDEATQRAEERLTEFGLTGAGRKHTWELSGGQQQRLAIAAALAVDTEVLVFDTATDMLDPEGRADVTNLVSSLTGAKTLVVTENNPDALVGIADEVLVLDDGDDIAYGPAEDVLRNGELLNRVGVAQPTCLAAANDLGLEESPITIGGFVDAWEDAGGPNDSTVRSGAYDQQTRTVPDGGGGGSGGGGGGGGGDLRTNGSRDAVIDADGVTYEYPDGTEALPDVDLTVWAGEVHGGIGEMGRGNRR